MIELKITPRRDHREKAANAARFGNDLLYPCNGKVASRTRLYGFIIDHPIAQSLQHRLEIGFWEIIDEVRLVIINRICFVQENQFGHGDMKSCMLWV